MILLSIVSTSFVLQIFSLPSSNLILTVSVIFYIVILFLTIEALFFKIELRGSKLHSWYFNVDLSDIIDFRYSVLGVKLRTRWRVYHLPPIKTANILDDTIKNQDKSSNRKSERIFNRSEFRL